MRTIPNRIIKESICTSDTIDQLSWFEETFFYRLIVNCDDYGRFDARPPILKARLFPLKNVTEKQVSDALSKLSTVGIVTVYEYDGRPYLQLVTWDNHQQIRAKRSKYPAYDETCNQMISDDIKCPRNPIQSNPIQSESNTYSSEIIRMAEKLQSLILQNNPNAKTPKDLIKWQADFDKMKRLDKRTDEQIFAVMEFSQKDSFWKSNILSAGKLREKFDTLILQKDRPKTQQSKTPQKGNFEQRQYSEDHFDKLYKEV